MGTLGLGSTAPVDFGHGLAAFVGVKLGLQQFNKHPAFRNFTPLS
jgi:hypothetical protein